MSIESLLDLLPLGLAFATAWAAGMVNSIAGGGTLLTFPTLLAAGLGSHAANVTSTMGLWPGSLGGAWGYRREIAAQKHVLWLLCLPSAAGGLLGAWLLLLTEDRTLRLLIPWLILGATLTFIFQGRLAGRRASPQPALTASASLRRWVAVILLQFVIAVYGGYFGAGIGILMLAGLGILGIDDIHQRNGIKNLAAGLINIVAAARFAFSPHVHWPIAAVMAVAAIAGAYLSAGIARRIGPVRVRRCVIAVGLLATAATLYQYWL